VWPNHTPRALHVKCFICFLASQLFARHQGSSMLVTSGLTPGCLFVCPVVPFLCFSSSSSLRIQLSCVRHTLEGLALSKSILVLSASVCMQAAVLFVLSSSLSPLVLRLQPEGSSGLHHGSGAVSSESSRPGMCQQRLHSIQGSGSLHCSWTQSAPLSTPGECHCKLLLSGPAIQGSSIGFRV